MKYIAGTVAIRCPGGRVARSLRWTSAKDGRAHLSRATSSPSRIADRPASASERLTPASNLKKLELATALSAPQSTEHAAQVYRVVNLIPVLWWLPMILAPNWSLVRKRAQVMRQSRLAF